MFFIYLGAVLVGCLLMYIADKIDYERNLFYRILRIKFFALGLVLTAFGALLIYGCIKDCFNH